MADVTHRQVSWSQQYPTGCQDRPRKGFARSVVSHREVGREIVQAVVFRGHKIIVPVLCDALIHRIGREIGQAVRSEGFL